MFQEGVVRCYDCGGEEDISSDVEFSDSCQTCGSLDVEIEWY